MKATMEMFETPAMADAVVLVALPTAGSASPIAAQYIIRHLDLPLVGHLSMPELHQVTSIQEGRALSPIRVHGGAVKCRIGGKSCPNLFIVSSDLPVPGPIAGTIIDTILQFATTAHLVLVLEAVVRAADDETPDVYVASAQPQVLLDLKASGLPPMPRAVIAGFTAMALMTAETAKTRVGALLVEADPQHPDGRAAAALVEALSRLVSDIALDAAPLREEADALEREIREAQKAAKGIGAGPASTFV